MWLGLYRTTVANQRLPFGLISPPANMPEICLFQIFTLNPTNQWWCASNWGVVTCWSHVGSCFKRFMCPENGLISSSSVTCWIAENRHTRNCLLAHVCYHNRNYNLTGPPPTFQFRQEKNVRPSKRRHHVWGMLVCLLLKTWPSLLVVVSSQFNCKVTPSLGNSWPSLMGMW